MSSRDDDTGPTGLTTRLKGELRAVGLATLYFACWLGPLVAIKTLILEEYRIEFSGLGAAVVGVLVLAKVVIVLEHVPLGAWVRRRPAWVDVVLRTGLYTAGVVAVLLLEKGFEARHEHGGLVPALAAVLRHADVPHVATNAIVVCGALLGYNVLSVLRRHLGPGGLRRLFLTPVPPQSGPARPG